MLALGCFVLAGSCFTGRLPLSGALSAGDQFFLHYLKGGRQGWERRLGHTTALPCSLYCFTLFAQ